MKRPYRHRFTRLIEAGIAAGALLVASAGGALAVRGGTGVQQARPFQYAATFHVTAPLGGGVVEVPWPAFGDGRVSFHSNCSAEYHPGDEVTPAYNGVAGQTLAVWNESTDRIGLADVGSDSPPNGFLWLQPKGTTPPPGYEGPWDRGGFGAGEMVNETQPDGTGRTLNIAILDPNGTTATGTFGWSASYDAAKQVGVCTFSLQLKG